MSTLDERAEQITAIKDEIDLKREEAYELKMNSSSIEATIEANNSQIEEKEKILDKNITANDSVTTTKEELISNLNSKNTSLNEILEKENKYNEDKKIFDEKYYDIPEDKRSYTLVAEDLEKRGIFDNNDSDIVHNSTRKVLTNDELSEIQAKKEKKKNDYNLN